MLTFHDEKRLSEIEDYKKEEEERLVKRLSDSYGLPYIDLRGLAPEADAMKLINKDEAVKTGMAPFRLVGQKLYIALLSPEKEDTKALLSSLSTRGSELVLFLASHASLQHVYDRYEDADTLTKVESGDLNLSSGALKDVIEALHSIDDVTRIIAGARSASSQYRTSRVIELIFAGATALGASDIHIEPGETQTRIRYRIDGVLQEVATVDQVLGKQIATRLKLLSGLKIALRSIAQDGRFSIDLTGVELEVRVSLVPGNYGEGFVMRLLDPRSIVVDIETMGMDDLCYAAVERAIGKPHGIVLTTGPTGSGKSTTLYAFLRKLSTSENKIMTIENPVEYHLDGITQTQVDEKKNYTFLSGLRAALRQDPDIIMVGEIRDEETAKVAVNAALTGHLVFSTLHTNNAAGTIPRLIDLGVDGKILGSALSLSLAQRLARKVCPHCAKEREATEKEARTITTILGTMKTDGKEAALHGFTPALGYTIKEAVGCEKCSKGYKGRVGLYEAIAMDKEVERLLVGIPSEREVKEAAKHQGIPTLREDAILKVLRGITTFDEVSKVVDLYEE